MVRTGIRIAIGFALLAGMITPVGGEEARASKSGTTTVRAKSILGTKVAVRGGSSVGTVEDIVLSNEGVVDYLIVSNEGKLVTVPWDAAKFDYERRTATIDITQDAYHKIPTYTSERYPEFYAPTYRGQMYKYYGLTPGQERRLERRIERRDRRP